MATDLKPILAALHDRWGWETEFAGPACLENYPDAVQFCARGLDGTTPEMTRETIAYLFDNEVWGQIRKAKDGGDTMPMARLVPLQRHSEHSAEAFHATPAKNLGSITTGGLKTGESAGQRTVSRLDA